MKRDFTDENFEEFLRNQAGSLRMRPSDTVWTSISRQLKTQRRSKGFVYSSLFLLLALFGWLNTAITPVFRTNNSTNLTSLPTQNSDNTIGNNDEDATADNELEIASRTNLTATVIPMRINGLPLRTSSNGVETIAEDRSVEVPVSEPNASAELLVDLEKSSAFTPVPVDEYEPIIQQEENTKDELVLNPLPTVESVVNLYQQQPKKFSVQYYFAPTISYRSLSENRDYLKNTAASYQPLAEDVNSAVTHKPDMGLEMGVAAKYAVSPRVKLRAGLQMNMTRYEIRVFDSPSEVGTIMFNGGRADSMNLVSAYSNRDGYNMTWLQNLYFQISAPVGVEVMLAGNKRTSFGIAGTVQPTYVLGDRSYAITTDYKNYAEIPNLGRQWNVNTSFETFVNYTTGHVTWQVGPQVRYQLLSSYISKYPVKENLFDFGLKVGLTLNK